MMTTNRIAEVTEAHLPLQVVHDVIDIDARRDTTPRPSPLASALAAARGKCRAAAKDATNGHHKYRYASAESIIDEARAALADSGVAVIPVGQELRAEGGGHTLRRRLLLAHASGEQLAVTLDWPVCPDKGRPLDKALAAAVTTSLAYFLRDLLLMPRVDPQDDVAGREDRPACPENIGTDEADDLEALVTAAKRTRAGLMTWLNLDPATPWLSLSVPQYRKAKAKLQGMASR